MGRRRVWPGVALVLALSLFCAVPAFGVVPEGRIEGIPGLRFENVVYGLKNLWLDVVNMTDRNLRFGGMMIFLDRHGNPVARASLLPGKVNRNAVKRWTGYFLMGDGEAARRGVRVIWDFAP